MSLDIDARHDLAMHQAIGPHLEQLALQARKLVEDLRQCQAQRRPVDRAALRDQLDALKTLVTGAKAQLRA